MPPTLPRAISLENPPRRRHAVRVLAALACAGAVATLPSFAAGRPLTAASPLGAMYGAILDARFTDLPALRVSACGGAPGTRPAGRASRAGDYAPAEACDLLDLVGLWWRLLLDPQDRSGDAVFAARADAVVDSLEALASREPARAEAWFYLGGAYGARAQWRVLRGERLAAARDGKRIREALETALALEPDLHDAYFGIGLYRYYAGVAPAAARVLRWLLALPGGDKVRGMREMLRARENGQLLRDEADYQLHLIYLWYEKDPQKALTLVNALKERHPGNPLFPQLAADIQDVYLHDPAASLDEWRGLFDAARAQRVREAPLAAVRARLGMAAALDQLSETDLAIDHLRAVIAAHPAAPYGAVAQAHLQLGQALDRLGSRDAALAAYKAAITAAPADDALAIGARARSALRQTPDTDETVAYRLSLEGLRALERDQLAEAAQALTRSLALRPHDQVTRYRVGRLRAAQRQEIAAIEIFEQVMIAGEKTPPAVFALASLDAARLYERQGNPARAIELYDRARTTIGAARSTREAASRALERLGR